MSKDLENPGGTIRSTIEGAGIGYLGFIIGGPVGAVAGFLLGKVVGKICDDRETEAELDNHAHEAVNNLATDLRNSGHDKNISIRYQEDYETIIPLYAAKTYHFERTNKADNVTSSNEYVCPKCGKFKMAFKKECLSCDVLKKIKYL
jgi:rubrerythrin